VSISEKLRQFIFEYVDSVEQLEILILLNGSTPKWWRPNEVTDEFRSTSASVSMRLQSLEKLGLIEQSPDGLYRYRSVSPEVDEIVKELSQSYKVRRHKVLELIFSPMKRARGFADAFRVGKPKKDDGGKDG
jgi:DNA-binding MarR family transcriptional regulator